MAVAVEEAGGLGEQPRQLGWVAAQDGGLAGNAGRVGLHDRLADGRGGSRIVADESERVSPLPDRLEKDGATVVAARVEDEDEVVGVAVALDRAARDLTCRARDALRVVGWVLGAGPDRERECAGGGWCGWGDAEEPTVERTVVRSAENESVLWMIRPFLALLTDVNRVEYLPNRHVAPRRSGSIRGGGQCRPGRLRLTASSTC
jgi:hypothetical protein